MIDVFNLAGLWVSDRESYAHLLDSQHHPPRKEMPSLSPACFFFEAMASQWPSKLKSAIGGQSVNKISFRFVVFPWARLLRVGLERNLSATCQDSSYPIRWKKQSGRKYHKPWEDMNTEKNCVAQVKGHRC